MAGSFAQVSGPANERLCRQISAWCWLRHSGQVAEGSFTRQASLQEDSASLTGVAQNKTMCSSKWLLDPFVFLTRHVHTNNSPQRQDCVPLNHHRQETGYAPIPVYSQPSV